MGGLGSGNWHGRQAKQTVESSLVVAVGLFRDRLFAGASGSFVWSWANGHTASVGYAVSYDAGLPVVTLQYRWADEDVQIPVRLQTTPTQFGGRRWWFTCPLFVNGKACRRRVGKLYSPPGERYFGCRTCYGLTYRSCQESHQTERMLARLEGLAGLDARISRLLA